MVLKPFVFFRLVMGWGVLGMLLCALAGNTLAQVGHDCGNPIPLCNNFFVQPAPTGGPGAAPNEIDTALTCFDSTEANGLWYVISPQTAGQLRFQIIPNNPAANYDFQVYNLTNISCGQALANPAVSLVSCNFSNTPGNTGPNGGVATSQGSGGTPTNASINVVANSTYAIYVANTGNDLLGYTLNLTPSTSNLLNTSAPSIATWLGTQFDCGDDTLSIRFNDKVLCSSLQPSDFSLTGPGGPYAVTGVLAAGCLGGVNSFAQEVRLVISPGLQQIGNYTLSLAGDVTDICGNTANAGNVLKNIVFRTLELDSVATVFCGDNVLNVALNGEFDCSSLTVNSFQVLNPAGVPVPVLQARAPSCAYAGAAADSVVELTLAAGLNDPVGNYRLVLQPNALRDKCGAFAGTDTLNFGLFGPLTITSLIGTDTSVCQFSPVLQMQTVAGGHPNPQFVWSPAFVFNNPGISNPVATLSGSTTLSVFVQNGNCASNPVNITVDFLYNPGVSFGGETSLCRGQSTVLSASGATTYEWVELGVFDDSVTVSPPVSITYNVVPYNQYCFLDTFQVTVNVTQTPVGFISGPDTICQFDTTTVQFAGTFTAGDNPFWNFGTGANVLSGTGFGPYQVVWYVPGPQTVLLNTQTLNCPALFARNVEVIAKPLINAGLDQTHCLGGPGTVLQANVVTPEDCIYSWTPGTGLSTPGFLNPLVFPPVSTTYTLNATCGGCPGDPDQVLVSTVSRPLATAATAGFSLCEGTPAALSGSASGGTPPYAYEWLPTTGVATPYQPVTSINPDSSTLYRFVVTDTNGCVSDTALTLVTVNPRPQVSAGPDQFMCQGSAGVTLSGQLLNPGFGSYTYLWQPATGLSNPNALVTLASPNSTTTYTLTVTANSTGCSNQGTVIDSVATTTVFVTPRPLANAGPDDTLCVGDSLVIGLPPVGVGGPYVFEWTPNLYLNNDSINQPLSTPLSTVTYSFKVIAQGCESVADSITLVVEPQPTVTILTPDTTVCPTDSFLLRSLVTGAAGPVSYAWSPANLCSTPNAPQTWVGAPASTTITLAVSTSACQTPATDQVQVTVNSLPVVDVSQGGQKFATICLGDTLALNPSVTGSGPALYEWSPAVGLSSPFTLNTLAFPVISTKYVLTAVNAGCAVRDTFELFVADSLEVVAAVDTSVICAGGKVVLTSLTQQPANLQWLPANVITLPTAAQTNAYPATTTTFTLVAERDGCVDEDSLTVTVLPQPQAAIEVPPALGCQGLLVQFYDASLNAAGWQWSFGDGRLSNQQNPLHRFDSSGSFTVQLVAFGAGGCTDTALAETPVVVVDRATASFSTDPLPGDTLYLPEADIAFTYTGLDASKWFWDFGDGQTSRQPNPVHAYEVPGTYEVRLVASDPGGCTADTVVGRFVVLEPLLPIPSVFTPNGDGVNDLWSPGYVGDEAYELHVYDRWGKAVFDTDVRTDAWDGLSGGGNDCPTGTYFYHLEIGERIYKGSLSLLR